MGTEPYYYWQEDNLVLNLYVQPQASKDMVVGLYGNRLKVSITSSPVAGKANKHLLKFLAEHFDLHQSQLRIIRGERNKHKSILIFRPNIALIKYKKY